MDICYEQMMKKQKNAVDWLKIGGALVLAINFTILIALAFIMFGINFYGMNLLMILAIWWGVVWVIRGTAIEYEYTITNHELDIDIIKGKSKRKHITTINLKKVEFLGNVNNPKIAEILKNAPTPTKKYYLLPDKKANNIYVTDVISKVDNKTVRVYIAPDEQMAEYMWLANPKAIIKEEIEK